MGNRLSKIYTRTGDQGTTGLGSNDRVSKDDLRVEAMGDVDELNACIGLVRLHTGQQATLDALLAQIQHDLFDLGGELSMPGYSLMREDLVQDLEAAIDQYNQDLPPLADFILPGGDPATAHLHLARTVCRRAERVLVGLNRRASRPVSEVAVQYLNRLSDLLFVLSRVTARLEGGKEVLWQSRHKKK